MKANQEPTLLAQIYGIY